MLGGALEARRGRGKGWRTDSRSRGRLRRLERMDWPRHTVAQHRPRRTRRVCCLGPAPDSCRPRVRPAWLCWLALSSLSPRRQPSSSLPTPRLDAAPDSCPPQAGQLVVLAGTRPSRAGSPRPRRFPTLTDAPASPPVPTRRSALRLLADLDSDSFPSENTGRSAKRAGPRPVF